MFSQSNSYDYKRYYKNNLNTLPFTGTYESTEGYKCIQIYVTTTKNDTLYIDYTNNKDDTGNEITENYNINNDETEFIIHTKLKFFRIRITTADTFSASDKRIYNVSLSLIQMIGTNKNGQIGISEPTSFDSFGRLRMSQPYTIFDSKNVGKQNGKFTYCTTGTGQTPSYNSTNSTIGLTCNAGTGLVINESKCRFAYQPGKSLLIMNTFCFGSVTTGTPDTSITTQRVGYFDDDNGIYLEINPSGVFINKRSSIAGLTESISISNWNGNSWLKTNLNLSKSQIFWIDLEWLGVGSVRTGFVIDGEYYIAHSFHHANSINTTYMTSAQLPIRYQINSSGTATNCTLTQICSTVISEGGYEGNSIIRHIGTDTSGTLISNISTININVPCCAIRIGTDPSGSILNSADTSGTMYNSIIVPSQMSIYINTPVGSTNNTQSVIEYRLILNPTISYSTGYSWKKYSSLYTDDTSSTVEYLLQSDFSGNGIISGASAISGGIVVNNGFIETRTSYGLNSPKDFNFQLGRIIDSYTTLTKYHSDVLVLALRLVFKGDITIANAGVKLGWYEL